MKFSLYEMKDERLLAGGVIEKIGEELSTVTLTKENKKSTFEKRIKDHHKAVEVLEEILQSYDILRDLNDLDVVGHRVVHGGEEFTKPTLIDKNVIEKIRSLFHLAPLHNPANLEGIEAVLKKAPFLKQVAVFDTAFHQSMPKYASMYAIDRKFYKDFYIRRYGFHGTSHHYVAKESAKYLKKEFKSINLITLHIGNGASACAVQEGKSIDTSMGFTPLEGLVMGTRSGDIDAGVIFYLSRQMKMSIDEIDTLLNKKSGLKGLCGKNDLREIEKSIKEGDKDALLAFEIFCYRIKKYIGAYFAVMGRVDAVVFTAGIGENSKKVREKVCKGLQNMGIVLDKEANEKNLKEISKKESRTKILVIPTNEEIEIARQSMLCFKDNSFGFHAE